MMTIFLMSVVEALWASVKALWQHASHSKDQKRTKGVKSTLKCKILCKEVGPWSLMTSIQWKVPVSKKAQLLSRAQEGVMSPLPVTQHLQEVFF
jgi:hypothetical protein